MSRINVEDDNGGREVVSLLHTIHKTVLESIILSQSSDTSQELVDKVLVPRGDDLDNTIILPQANDIEKEPTVVWFARPEGL